MISATRRTRTDRERSFLTGEPEYHAAGRDDPDPAGLSTGMRRALLVLPERALGRAAGGARRRAAVGRGSFDDPPQAPTTIPAT
ncbi:hypothetical protein BH20ACT16_BH20ACT16_02010 [soil metagenome]